MTDSFVRQAALRALNGLKMVLGRGRILLTNENENGGTQFIQVKVSANETMDVPRLAEFGFASRVPVKGDCILVFLNAERTLGVALATGHQTYRFKLQNDGEAVLYDAFGKSILLGKDGTVVEAGGKPVTVNNAKGLTINSTDDVTLNMGGKKVFVNNAAEVHLSGVGGRKVVCDGDPVSGGVVHADAGQKVFGT